jgi:hypothetical protein
VIPPPRQKAAPRTDGPHLGVLTPQREPHHRHPRFQISGVHGPCFWTGWIPLSVKSWRPKVSPVRRCGTPQSPTTVRPSSRHADRQTPRPRGLGCPDATPESGGSGSPAKLLISQPPLPHWRAFAANLSGANQQKHWCNRKLPHFPSREAPDADSGEPHNAEGVKCRGDLPPQRCATPEGPLQWHSLWRQGSHSRACKLRVTDAPTGGARSLSREILSRTPFPQALSFEVESMSLPAGRLTNGGPSDFRGVTASASGPRSRFRARSGARDWRASSLDGGREKSQMSHQVPVQRKSRGDAAHHPSNHVISQGSIWLGMPRRKTPNPGQYRASDDVTHCMTSISRMSWPSRNDGGCGVRGLVGNSVLERDRVPRSSQGREC